MQDQMELLYPTESVIDDALLKKALLGSVRASWRKWYYIIIAALYVLLLGVCIVFAIASGTYAPLIRAIVITLAVALLVALMWRNSLNTSIRRWKEQNPEQPVHMTTALTDTGVYLANSGNSTVIAFEHIVKVFAIKEHWLFRTKGGLLVFYHAGQLSDTDRQSVIALLRDKCPKIKFQI